MSFAQTLERLQKSVDDRQPGVNAAFAYVRRRDLRELLQHFNRLDAEARARHRSEHPEV
jgi:hypothetical protein